MAGEFESADQYASQIGTGTDPSQEALLQALAQIRQSQGPPRLPDSPLAQFGIALSGITSAMGGKPEPMLAQAMAGQAADLAGFKAQASIAQMLGQLSETSRGHRIQEATGRRQDAAEARMGAHETRMAEEKRTDMFLSMSKTLVDMGDIEMGAQFMGQAISRVTGKPLSPDALKNLGVKPLKDEEINAIYGKAVAGMPVEDIATLYRRPVEIIESIARVGDTPGARQSFGLKSKAAAEKEEADAKISNLNYIQKHFEYLHPGVTQDALTQFELAHTGKRFENGTPEEQRAAVNAAEVKRVNEQRGLIDYRANADLKAQLDRTLPPTAAAQYVDARTYLTPKGVLTQRSIEANRNLVHVPDPATRRSLPAMVTLRKTIDRVMEIHDKKPQYWPPEAIDEHGRPKTVQNMVNMRKGQLTMAANVGIDPDLAEIRALTADIIKLATTAGATGRFSTYVAQLEKDAAGWDQPGTRESKVRQLQTSRERLNDALQALGLDPMPDIVTLRDGTRAELPRTPR